MQPKPHLLVAGHLVALAGGLVIGLIAASVYVFVSAAYHGELETLVKNEYAPGGLDLALSTAVQNGCFVFLVCVLAALLPIDPPWTVTAPRRIQVIERIGHALAWRGGL